MVKRLVGCLLLPLTPRRVMPISDADPQRAHVADALQTVGYGEKHLEYDWPILNHSALASMLTGSGPLRLDLAAFHDDRRHDWNTSAVVCNLNADRAVVDPDLGHQQVR